MKLLADYNTEELKSLLGSDTAAYRAKQLFKWVSMGASYDEMTDLPKQLRTALAEEYAANSLQIEQEVKAADGSTKLLYRLFDGNIIEGIFMPHDYGNTLCVSTQVGCKMKCAFCASGLDGLVRNLSAGEIYGQVIAANRRFAKDGGRTLASKDGGRTLSNIVLMGSGEPLDNYDAVAKFIKLVCSADGLGISQRGISVSTCGLPDMIRRLADDGFSVTLSISLHATTDEVRQDLMPIATRYRMTEVLDAARYYFAKTGRRVIIEYAMIKGLNTTFFDAKRLKDLLKGMSVHINLIPLNYVAESRLIPATKPESRRFLDRLAQHNLSATIRHSAGSEVSGACGQLRNQYVGQKQP